MLPERHTLIAGPTRVGKSNFAVHLALHLWQSGYSLTFVLPHLPPLILLVAEVYARLRGGVRGRLLVEDVGRMDRVIMRPFIHFSTESDLLAQMRDDRLYEERALQPCIARSGLNLSETPAKEKYARLAIKLFQEARRNGAEIGEGDLIYLLYRNSDIQKYALAHCKREDIRREYDLVNTLPIREFTSMVESAIRFLEPVYRSPVILARTSKQPNFDWPAFFRTGGIHIVTKGKASTEDFRVFVKSDFLMKRRLAEDGYLTKHQWFCDEINNYGIFDDFMAEALSTTGYLDFWLKLIVQLLDFPTPEQTANVMSNTEHVIFRQSDPELADYFARDLRGLMDRNKIHHWDETSRQVHDGFDVVERITKGKTKGKAGSSESESVAPQLIPKYRQEIDRRAVYENSSEQSFWTAQNLMNPTAMPVGACHIKPSIGLPEFYQTPLVVPSFFSHDVEAKVAECLTLITATAPYETPLPPAATISPSPVNETSEPSTSWTPLQQPTNNSRGSSIRQPRKRGKGSKKPKKGE